MNRKKINKTILAGGAAIAVFIIGAAAGSSTEPETVTETVEVSSMACTSAIKSSEALQLIYAETLNTSTAMVDQALNGETANLESGTRTLQENQAKIIQIQVNYDKFSKQCLDGAK